MSEDDRTKAAIGQRLELTREAIGLKQGDFAREAGLSQSRYSQYESGGKQPSIDAANQLCDRYNLTLDWIYRGDTSGLRYPLASAIHSLQKLRDGDTSSS